MKNILVIDGADNCAYDLFAATDEEFAMIFPREEQDIAFIDEVVASAPRGKADHGDDGYLGTSCEEGRGPGDSWHSVLPA